MKKYKSIITKIPTLYLLIIIILYWFDTAILFNPVAILLISLIGIFLIFKNNYIGIVFSSLILLINIYLIFALTSEYREFENYNKGLPLLLTGLIIIITNILSAIYIIVSSSHRAQAIHSHKIELEKYN